MIIEYIVKVVANWSSFPSNLIVHHPIKPNLKCNLIQITHQSLLIINSRCLTAS